MLAVQTAAQAGVLVAARTACTCTDRACPTSSWAHVKQAPPDAILGVVAAFNADPRKDKVNLSVGAYRDENGKPVVLKCVRKAEASLLKKHPGHEYLPVCFKRPPLQHSFSPPRTHTSRTRATHRLGGWSRSTRGRA